MVALNPLPNTHRHGHRALRARVGQDERELVTAEPGHDVGFTGALADDGAGLDERLAACQVAVAVVDLLEAVQVEKQHRQRPAAAHRALGFAAQHQVQVAGVGEPRQVVGHRQRLGLLQGQGVVERDRWRLQHAPHGQHQRRPRATAPGPTAADRCPRARRRPVRGRSAGTPAPSLRRGRRLAGPCEIGCHQLGAVAHHPFGRRPQGGPRFGVRPMSAIAVSRSLLSRATTAQHGAGIQSLAWRTSQSATLTGPAKHWTRGRPGGRRRGGPGAHEGSGVWTSSGLRGPDGGSPGRMRGVLAAFRPPDLTARCGGLAGTG